MKQLFAIAALLVSSLAQAQTPAQPQGYVYVTDQAGNVVPGSSRSQGGTTAADRGTNANSIATTYGTSGRVVHFKGTTYAFGTIPTTTPQYVGTGAATVATISSSTLSQLATFIGQCRSMKIVGSDGNTIVDSTGARTNGGVSPVFSGAISGAEWNGTVIGTDYGGSAANMVGTSTLQGTLARYNSTRPLIEIGANQSGNYIWNTDPGRPYIAIFDQAVDQVESSGLGWNGTAKRGRYMAIGPYNYGFQIYTTDVDDNGVADPTIRDSIFEFHLANPAISLTKSGFDFSPVSHCYFEARQHDRTGEADINGLVMGYETGWLSESVEVSDRNFIGSLICGQDTGGGLILCTLDSAVAYTSGAVLNSDQRYHRTGMRIGHDGVITVGGMVGNDWLDNNHQQTIDLRMTTTRAAYQTPDQIASITFGSYDITTAQVTEWLFAGSWANNDIITVDMGTGHTVQVTTGSTSISTILDTLVAALNASTDEYFAGVTWSKVGTTTLRGTNDGSGEFNAVIRSRESNGANATAQTIDGVATTKLTLLGSRGHNTTTGNSTQYRWDYSNTNDVFALNGTTSALALPISLGAASAITQSGTLATVTVASTSGLLPGNRVTIAGATPAGYNGNYLVHSVTSATQFTIGPTVASLGAGSATTTTQYPSFIQISNQGGGYAYAATLSRIKQLNLLQPTGNAFIKLDAGSGDWQIYLSSGTTIGGYELRNNQGANFTVRHYLRSADGAAMTLAGNAHFLDTNQVGLTVKFYSATTGDLLRLYKDDASTLMAKVDASGVGTFAGGVVLESVAGGSTSGAITNDSTQKAIRSYVNGIAGMGQRTLFTQTASVTATDTTSAVTLVGAGVGTMTLPANYFVAGKTIRLKARGYYSNDESDAADITLRFSIGTGSASNNVTITSPAASLASGDIVQKGWECEFIATCRQTGSTATIIVEGSATFDPGAAGVQYGSMVVNTAAANVNTANGRTVDLLYLQNSAGGGGTNNCVCTQLTLEELN